MTMTGLFVDHGNRILAAVALLLAVLSSPIRPTRESHSSFSPHPLQRNFAILKIGHGTPFAMAARRCLREADSLQPDIEGQLDAEFEDELTISSPPASVSFDVLPAPCPKPYRELVRFAVPLATRPLRC
jgi:hypothetical protein